MNPTDLSASSAPKVEDEEISQKIITDLINFEHRQREIYNELITKTDKIEKLQKDLGAANLQTIQMNVDLEDSKSKIRELERGLSAAVEKSFFLENQLKDKGDSISNNQLLYNRASTENDALHKMVANAEADKFELTKKLEDLREHDEAFRNESIEQDSKIQSSISELEESIAKLEKDQKQAVMLSQANKDNISSQYYREEVRALRKINFELEDKLTCTNVKCEKLEQMLSDLKKESESSLSFQEWQQCSQYHKKQLKNNSDTIDKLTTALKTEKEVNEMLIVKDQKNTICIDKLQQMIGLLNEKDESCDAQMQTDEEPSKIDKIECEAV